MVFGVVCPEWGLLKSGCPHPWDGEVPSGLRFIEKNQKICKKFCRFLILEGIKKSNKNLIKYFRCLILEGMDGKMEMQKNM